MEAIVLRTTPYGETNKIVTLYTERLGKVAVIARGARKPRSKFTSCTQPFTIGLFVAYMGKGMGHLQQGEALYSLRKMREDLDKSAAAAYLVELVEKTVEDRRPSPSLYGLLKRILLALEDGDDPESYTRFLEVKLLPVLGLYPVLGQCTNCGAKEGEFRFSIRENGLLCHRCYDHDPHAYPASVKALSILHKFERVGMDQLGSVTLQKGTLKELRHLLWAYYDAYSGLYCKSRKFLEQMEHWGLGENKNTKTKLDKEEEV